VVGALINRGAGKTGKEMIPNSKFWMELPGLISVRLPTRCCFICSLVSV